MQNQVYVICICMSNSTGNRSNVIAKEATTVLLLEGS